MDDKVYLSKEKLEELKKELEQLKTDGRKEIAAKLEYAKSLGDLSENSEYLEARESRESLEERIATIESVLKSAVVVSSHKSDIVDVGTTVVVEKVGGSRQKYTLVGSEEVDIAGGKISNRSPLGEKLIGKRAGDSFSLETPGGKVIYKILKVE